MVTGSQSRVCSGPHTTLAACRCFPDECKGCEPHEPVHLGSSGVAGADADIIIVCEFQVWFLVTSAPLHSALLFAVLVHPWCSVRGDFWASSGRDPSVSESNRYIIVDIDRFSFSNDRPHIL